MVSFLKWEMKCELLDYWSVLDFDVTGLLDVDLPGECSRGERIRLAWWMCVKFLFVLFIYNQSLCQCPSWCMYKLLWLECVYNQMFTWWSLCGFYVVEILCILINVWMPRDSLNVYLCYCHWCPMFGSLHPRFQPQSKSHFLKHETPHLSPNRPILLRSRQPQHQKRFKVSKIHFSFPNNHQLPFCAPNKNYSHLSHRPAIKFINLLYCS